MGHRRRLKRLEKNNRDAEYDRKRERERAIVGLIMVEYHRLPKPAHGEFGPWLKENFAGSDRTARAYMRFHAHREELQAKRQSSAVLSIDGALKALSVPKADAQGAVLSSYPWHCGSFAEFCETAEAVSRGDAIPDEFTERYWKHHTSLDRCKRAGWFRETAILEWAFANAFQEEATREHWMRELDALERIVRGWIPRPAARAFGWKRCCRTRRCTCRF
jgi:hypothetical protein